MIDVSSFIDVRDIENRRVLLGTSRACSRDFAQHAADDIKRLVEALEDMASVANSAIADCERDVERTEDRLAQKDEALAAAERELCFMKKRVEELSCGAMDRTLAGAQT